MPVYTVFAQGASKAIPLVCTLFPFLACVTIVTRLLSVSGLEEVLLRFLSPAFRFFGVPEELAGLLFIKPLSGSGSMAVLAELLKEYGVDSYLARTACVLYGSSDTVFYVSAVYFAGVNHKKLPLAIFFALLAYLLSAIVCCALCRII